MKNVKRLTLVTGAALVFAGNANSAIVTSGDPDLILSINNVTTGDEKSMVLNTGVSLSDLATTNQSWIFDVSGLLIDGGDDVFFNVTGVDPDEGDSAYSSFSVVSGNTNNNAYNAVYTSWSQYAGTISADGMTPIAGGEVSSVYGPSDGQKYHSDNAFGGDFAGNTTGNNQLTLDLLSGTGGTLYSCANPASAFGNCPWTDTAIPFQLSWDEGSNTATFTLGAVPLPAAVWLFGSGLIGLAGVARRRRNTA